MEYNHHIQILILRYLTQNMNNIFHKYKMLLITLFGLFVFFALGYLSNIYIKNIHYKILNNNKFTIGKITEKRTETRSNYYNFIYNIENKKLKGGLSFNLKGKYSNLELQSRYFAIYDSLNHNSIILLPFLPVPDSITEAPPEGWKELPIP